MTADSIPAGWSYNPSRWSERSFLFVLALAGFAIAIYLSLYQFGILPTVWEPLFGDGSRQVLHSKLTRILPLPDAFLGAIGYLIEAVLAVAGGNKRWHAQPWLVIFYGFTVAALGLVSVILVVFQSAFLHEWCTLCLVSAAISIGLIAPVMDEPVASLQYLKCETENGNSAWQAFWGLQARGDG